MDKKEAKKLINNVFLGIKIATSCEDLQSLLHSESVLSKNKMDLDKYPKIGFTISSEDVENLIEARLLNSDFSLTEQATKNLDPLSKLLYAVIWKNGDLRKIRHIIQGVKNAGKVINDEENAVVFRQFGKFLNQRDEPIVDQHVIRAFALYFDSSKDFDQIRSIGLLNKRHQTYIDAYKNWLNSDEILNELKSQPEYTYYIDQLLFAVGKAVKIGKTAKNRKD